MVNDIHAMLVNQLHHEKRKFKSQENAIVGAEYSTASPQETPMLIYQWVGNVNTKIESAASGNGVIQAVCESHIAFEIMHPYADGNGRTDRLIMIYLLLKANLYPLIINKTDKYEYINFLSNQDVNGFTKYGKGKVFFLFE